MLAATLVNSLVIIIVVVIHYEFLSRFSSLAPQIAVNPRFRIVLGVGAALIAHVVEIWVFAGTYYLLIQQGTFGTLEGNFDGTLLTCCYFSFTSYTTLGFGDIYPSGHLRFLTGLESLTGLVLITWSASFLFLEMQSHWRTGKK